MIASALPFASRIYAYFSASAMLMFATLSPYDVRILALLTLSASACITIDF
jgi:hypothetical protein